MEVGLVCNFIFNLALTNPKVVWLPQWKISFGYFWDISILQLRLFLFFNRLKKIESSFYDGSDRRRIASILPHHPFGLGVFENFVYYTDWYKYGKGIRMLNRFTGRDKYKIKPTLWSHMDIHVYHPLRQPNGESSVSDYWRQGKGKAVHKPHVTHMTRA